MKSSTDLRKLITQAQTSGIASEDDARLKFINGLLDWLGFPDSCVGTNFPVYSSEGRENKKKYADYILFSESGQDLHRKETREDIDWVKDHSLLVVEAKRPEEIPDFPGQPQFYCFWTSAPAYLLTDSIRIIGFLPAQFSADPCVLNCYVWDLPVNGAIKCFLYNRLKELKYGEIEAKQYIEKVASDIALFPHSVEYTPVENYILRKVRKIVEETSSNGQLLAEPLPLLDANKNDKQIIVLGGAGTGKSKELQQLAYVCSQRKDWIPILWQLRDYVDEEIEDLIVKSTGLEYCSNSILLLDALDEIDESCLSIFMRRLNRYVDN